MLTPARRRGVEILDDPTTDPAIRERSIGEVMRSNQMLGGLRAALLAIREELAKVGTTGTLLDVGTGLADIPAGAVADAARRGVALTAIGIDEAASLLVAAGNRLTHAVAANALALPFRDHSIDVVMCSQVLHHFENADAQQLLAEMNRVARHAVVVSDLRRSAVAATGFWLVCFPLRYHRVTRHDGVVSIFRGFTARELNELIRAATGVAPIVRRRLGFRLTARWSPRIGA
jgi:ubiquinone/menaquinone biosynthesis C-methylase UbiE